MLLNAGYTFPINGNQFTRLKLYFRALLRQDDSLRLLLLPSYLRRYVELNNTASAVLQTDDMNCFYRAFVTIPDAAHVFKKLCIPALFIDGTFSKTHSYGGVLIPIVAADGSGGNIQIGIAWVPTESVEHFVFVLLSLRAAGIDIESIPIFTDRGHILGAAKVLLDRYNIKISIKYCLEHINRNLAHIFDLKASNPETATVRNLVGDMQNARSVGSFISACENIINLRPEDGVDIVRYLVEGIHPRHWCVFGNLASYPDSEWHEDYCTFYAGLIRRDSLSWNEFNTRHLKDEIPFGIKMPLYGFCRTNRVESACSWLAHHNIRSSPPAVAISMWLQVAKETIERYFEVVERTDGVSLLSVGARLFRDGKEKSSRCTKSRTYIYDNDFCASINSRQGATTTEHIVKVAQHNGQPVIKCCCFYSDMYAYPCAHVHCLLQHDYELVRRLCRNATESLSHSQYVRSLLNPSWAVPFV
ncbi:hypothetical protein FisN_1Lu437 [Fistulifera solaris]|uniref:SWIM-type domain-containing protein n=1 Tax=Fistulifera solaris TaxID=1519565 RepID=A0A1Z5K3T3_FISSO|nr:hypothetical protein FisN_1Lu437 [Fistulifera solaris]|eukprot:GAX20913.1 hypothetical protein FisN_1Lu437 [Fistulifera solaris]